MTARRKRSLLIAWIALVFALVALGGLACEPDDCEKQCDEPVMRDLCEECSKGPLSEKKCAELYCEAATLAQP